MLKRPAATAFMTMLFAFAALAAPAAVCQRGAAFASTAAQANERVYTEGQAFYQAAGTTCTYDLDWLADSWYSDSPLSREVRLSDSSLASCTLEDGSYRIALNAKRAGNLTVTLVERWEAYSPYDDEPAVEETSHSFSVHMVTLKNTTGTLAKTVPAGAIEAPLFTYKLSGLPADASVEVVDDSNKGGCSVREVKAGAVRLAVYGAGTHKVKLGVLGKTVTLKAVLRELDLKSVSTVGYTGSLTTYPGEKTKLQATLTGVKNPKVTWKSTNSKVAKVSKKGVVSARKKGRCTVKVKQGDAVLALLVDVVPQKACKAVRNGFADMNTKLAYSQGRRMEKKYRDCSSFVSRCYWDASLGRRLFALGGESAKSWAGTAASQARWLNARGKRVAWKAVAARKLRPGDTVHYQTNYAGEDSSRWRGIDHVALYAGNGCVLTTGGYGGKGTIGLSRYYPEDTSVKFIGRPCK